MDYVLMKYYPYNVWICGDTYESLIWKDTTREKPSEEELNIKGKELKKEIMREERNQLLKDCDFRVYLIIQIQIKKRGYYIDTIYVPYLKLGA